MIPIREKKANGMKVRALLDLNNLQQMTHKSRMYWNMKIVRRDPVVKCGYIRGS